MTAAVMTAAAAAGESREQRDLVYVDAQGVQRGSKPVDEALVDRQQKGVLPGKVSGHQLRGGSPCSGGGTPCALSAADRSQLAVLRLRASNMHTAKSCCRYSFSSGASASPCPPITHRSSACCPPRLCAGDAGGGGAAQRSAVSGGVPGGEAGGPVRCAFGDSLACNWLPPLLPCCGAWRASATSRSASVKCSLPCRRCPRLSCAALLQSAPHPPLPASPPVPAWPALALIPWSSQNPSPYQRTHCSLLTLPSLPPPH